MASSELDSLTVDILAWVLAQTHAFCWHLVNHDVARPHLLQSTAKGASELHVCEMGRRPQSKICFRSGPIRVVVFVVDDVICKVQLRLTQACFETLNVNVHQDATNNSLSSHLVGE